MFIGMCGISPLYMSESSDFQQQMEDANRSWDDQRKKMTHHQEPRHTNETAEKQNHKVGLVEADGAFLFIQSINQSFVNIRLI